MAAWLWFAVLTGSVGLPIAVAIVSVLVFRDLPRSRGRVVAAVATAVWAAAALALAALLAFTGGGHPPPIVLLPVVPFLWGLVQAGLTAAAWLLLRVRRPR